MELTIRYTDGSVQQAFGLRWWRIADGKLVTDRGQVDVSRIALVLPRASQPQAERATEGGRS